MIKAPASLKFGLMGLVVVALAQPACNDDEGGSTPTNGGVEDAQGGNDAAGSDSGEQGGNGARGGNDARGGAIGAEAGAGEKPQAGANNGGAGGDGATPQAGATGSGGEGIAACAGEVIAGECFETPFVRVQIATQSAGTAATMDTVKLPNDTTSGSTLVLSVGVIWSGTSQKITVPSGFELIVRADNTTGASGHESAALYIAESAPTLAAATGANVTVAAADARLFLGLTEYTGLRATGALDRSASQVGSGAASPGTTALTRSPVQLWLVLTMSRGGSGHSTPTNDFEISAFKNTGAGSFSLMEKLVETSGMATAGLTSSGDYASLIATLRR